MSHEYGGTINAPVYRDAPPNRKLAKIVSEKEARDTLSQFLNGRLNAILDHLPVSKMRACLPIDVEKSFVPCKPLSWIVTEMECRDPNYHFEYDPRDDSIKFVPNGETYEKMPVRMETPSSMSRPSSSDGPKRHIPVEQICDEINQKLREASKGKFSVARVHNLIAETNTIMEVDEVMQFLRTHTETGDIFATLVESTKLLQYNAEDDEKRRRNSLKKSVEKIREGDSREEKEEDGEREEWRDGDMKAKNAVDEANGYPPKGHNLKEELKKTFPHIRRLNYLIYLLQRVNADIGKEAVSLDTFKQRLDDVVGGTLDWSLFGLTLFIELVYHRVVEVVKSHDDVKIRLNPLITESNCRVEFLRGYLAGEMYNYIRKNGRKTYKEIYTWIDSKNSPFLHDQFPKWKTWGEKEKIEDVRAQYKTHWEVFELDGDSLDLNAAFAGICTSPFLEL